MSELAGQAALTQLQYYDARMRACDLAPEEIGLLDQYRCEADRSPLSRTFAMILNRATPPSGPRFPANLGPRETLPRRVFPPFRQPAARSRETRGGGGSSHYRAARSHRVHAPFVRPLRVRGTAHCTRSEKEAPIFAHERLNTSCPLPTYHASGHVHPHQQLPLWDLALSDALA